MQIEPEIKKECNLMEALELVGLGWLPCVDNDELLLQENRIRVKYWWRYTTTDLWTDPEQAYFNHMQIAIAKIEHLLRNHKISISGEYTADIFNTGDEDKSIADAIIENGTPRIDTDIETELVLKYYGNGKEAIFIYPRFKVSELRQYAPNQKGLEPIKQEINGYISPYMQIMFDVIEKLRISMTNQPLKKQMVPEIQQIGREKYGIDITYTMANQMATLTRLPEAGKGGFKKQR